MSMFFLKFNWKKNFFSPENGAGMSTALKYFRINVVSFSSFTTGSGTFREFNARNPTLFQMKVFGRKNIVTMLQRYVAARFT